jgi:hypothetical protein
MSQQSPLTVRPGPAKPVSRLAAVGKAPTARPLRRSRQTATALWLADDLSFPAWLDLGRHIATIQSGSSWWIGDWVVYGHARYQRRYRSALRETNLDYKTLRNYGWVASRFAPHRRWPELSFQHHAEVAPLGEEEQDTWLRRASVHKWTRSELRRQLRAWRTVSLPAAVTARLNMEVESERHACWTSAAEAANESLREWIVRTLDQAAGAGRSDARAKG